MYKPWSEFIIKFRLYQKSRNYAGIGFDCSESESLRDKTEILSCLLNQKLNETFYEFHLKPKKHTDFNVLDVNLSNYNIIWFLKHFSHFECYYTIEINLYTIV